MNRAIVIRTTGDPAIAGAIVDGITQKVIPLRDGELAAIKAECARLRARNDIRACGDEKRISEACAALADKYPTEHHGRLYRAVWGLYGLVVVVVDGWYQYFSGWNRGER